VGIPRRIALTPSTRETLTPRPIQERKAQVTISDERLLKFVYQLRAEETKLGALTLCNALLAEAVVQEREASSKLLLAAEKLSTCLHDEETAGLTIKLRTDTAWQQLTVAIQEIRSQ
jgi:hypothetical protein